MFGSTVLEVAIGMSFCYAAVALMVSTIQEAIASALRLRARTLLAGVKAMCNDPSFNDLALSIYRHALVNPREDGQAVNHTSLAKKPSYIEPRYFAIAVVDRLQSVPGDLEQLGRNIEAISDPQLRAMLMCIHARAEGDIDKFQQLVCRWFDNAMERVSGAYKRRATLISFLLALLLAAAFNIDSIHLFRTLWQHPALAAAANDPRAFEALFALPVGWQHFPPPLDGRFLLQVAGWVMTATSAMFGAPFWFDLLQRLVRVRGTGHKPSEKGG
jgi:hypothetical protein